MLTRNFKTVVKLVTLSFFGALLAFVAAVANASNVPVGIEMVSFGGASLWQATSTVLMPTGTGGRYETESVVSLQAVSSCNDMLSTFQERPLSVMLKNGYINRIVYNHLMNTLKENLDARQLLLVTLFSDLSDAQVLEYFGESGVPQGRFLKGFIDKGGQKITRVTRGTLYAIRGQIIETEEKPGQNLHPRPLAWQLDSSLPQRLNNPLDRTSIKAAVEIGRAHSESGVLSGDLKLAAKLIFSTLENEFRAQSIDPNEVLVTAHFLDPQHTRFFTSHYPLRPLDAAQQRALETDLRGTLANYLSLKLPRGHKEWSEYQNVVTFGSLAALAGQNSVESFSESAYQIHMRSGQKISGAEALNMVTEFIGMFREDQNYSLPDYGRSPWPLMIRDRGTSLSGASLINVFRKYGLKEGTAEYNAVKAYIEPLYMNAEPDMFMQAWAENYYFFRIKNGATAIVQSLEVANLDPKAAVQRPVEYLASVILAMHDLVRARIENANPEIYLDILKWCNDARKRKGLALVSEINAEVFFETYPLVLSSTDENISHQLKLLGGQAVEAVAFNLDLRSAATQHQLQMGMVKAQMFEFRTPEIRQLSLHFNNLAAGARQRLNDASHRVRLNILNSAAK